MRILLFLNLILAFCSVNAQHTEQENKIYGKLSYDVMVIKIDSTISKRFQIIENPNLLNEKIIFDSLSKKGKFFAMNAGIVDSTCKLLGLFVNDSKLISAINLNQGTGNFYLQSNGFIGFNNGGVVIKKSTDYNNFDTFFNAVQSGPLLVENKVINGQFDKNSKNENFRVGVGMYTEKQQRFLVFAISNSPVTFYQFASMFLNDLKCDVALNIESGRISSLHLPSTRRIFNAQKVSCKYLYFKL